MNIKQLIESLDLSKYLKPIAETIVTQARSYFLSDSRSTKYEDDLLRDLAKFMKIFSSLSPTSQDYYKVRDFIIQDIPSFQQTDFPNTRG